MIVDTSAVIAILKGETDAPAIAACLAAAARPAISAANWTEAAIVADGDTRHGNDRDFDGFFDTFGIDIVPVTRDIAAEARAAYRRFGRGNHPARLNFGDCFAYALARARGEPLLFKGEDFARTDIEPALKTR